MTIDFSSLFNWFDGLWYNFLNIFSPITSFFSSLAGSLVNICGFIWSIFKFVGYGIATGLRYLRSVVDHLFSLSFWEGGLEVFRDLSVFLGVDTIYFAFMLYIAFLLIIFTFVSRFLFGKLNFVRKDRS